jgi:AraC-like DNA-binding protein/quercetin dioxygenase-like cupin family protein
MPTKFSKKDIATATAPTPLDDALAQVERDDAPLHCRAVDYPQDWDVAPHAHTKHQLIHALHGVMSVRTQAGHWVVPPSRGLWMPAGVTHAIRCIGAVQMRSVFVRPGAAPKLPGACCAVGISPLLRELIRSAAQVQQPYTPNSRDGRLMRLILDELHALPVLPLHLPMPTDLRVLQICQALEAQPDDASTLADWALHLGVDVKTVQRLFAAQTGLTFGRWRQQARLLRALALPARDALILEVGR